MAPDGASSSTYTKGTDGYFLKTSGSQAYWSALPTASTSATGIVQLNDSYSSTDGTKAATGKALLAALQTLDSTLPSGSAASKTLTALTITDGKMASATFTDISIGAGQIGSGELSVARGGTGKGSWTQWGIIYASATDTLAQVTAGASGNTGQPLISNGAAAPGWHAGLSFTGSAAASYVASFTGTTASTATSNGAVKIAGGLGVAGQVTALRLAANGSNTSYSLYVNGSSYLVGETVHGANVRSDTTRTDYLGTSSYYWQGAYINYNGNIHWNNMTASCGQNVQVGFDSQRSIGRWISYYGLQSPSDRLFGVRNSSTTVEYTTNSGSSWSTVAINTDALFNGNTMTLGIRTNAAGTGSDQYDAENTSSTTGGGSGALYSSLTGKGVRVTINMAPENRVGYIDAFLVRFGCAGGGSDSSTANLGRIILDYQSPTLSTWTTIYDSGTSGTIWNSNDITRIIYPSSSLYLRGSSTTASHIKYLRLTLLIVNWRTNYRYLPRIIQFQAFGGPNAGLGTAAGDTGSEYARAMVRNNVPYIIENYATGLLGFDSDFVPRSRPTEGAAIVTTDIHTIGTSTRPWLGIYGKTIQATTGVTSAANTAAYADVIIGNANNVNTKNAHAEGRIYLYSAATAAHKIIGKSTTSEYTHTFPNSTGWIVTGGNGTSTGAGDTDTPVYLDTNGILQPITSYDGKAATAEVTDGNSVSHGVSFWGDRVPSGVVETNVGVEYNSTVGNLYLFAKSDAKGLYSNTGYQRGAVIQIESGKTTFYGDLQGNASTASNFSGTVTVDHGGTNSSSFTGSKLLYTSSDGKTISSSSISTTGGYLANVSYLTVNGNHQTTYRVHISGSLCTTGTTYFNGTNYYINSSGTAKLNSITAVGTVYFNGTTYYVNSSGTANLYGITINDECRLKNGKDQCFISIRGTNNTKDMGYFGFIRSTTTSGDKYGDTRFRLVQYSYNNSTKARTDGYELYELPAVDYGLSTSTSKSYTILTTKNLTFEGRSFWANQVPTGVVETQIGVENGSTIGNIYLFANSSHNAKGIYCASGYGAGKIIWVDSNGVEITGTKVYGAVWNDYAEYRECDKLIPGTCVQEHNNGHLTQSDRRLIPGASIISDTFGFAEGQTEKADTPIAVSGRVLARTYRDRYEYHAGQAVCSAPDGTVDIMSRDEIMMYPDAIVGIVSEIPEYEEWGTDHIKVNNRIWIKVK